MISLLTTLLLAHCLYFTPVSSNVSCPYPAVCRSVKIDPAGLDPEKSPFYAVMVSDYVGAAEDNACNMYFRLNDSSTSFLMVETIVYKNGSHKIIKTLRSDISGCPGAYRYDGTVENESNDSETCVFIDFTLKALKNKCGGTFLAYRCPLSGACVNQFSGQGQQAVYLVRSALLKRHVPSCCGSIAMSIAQQQGLSQPICLSNKMPHKCVTRINGLTAINSHLVPIEESMEI